jgi:hypothetical protein
VPFEQIKNYTFCGIGKRNENLLFRGSTGGFRGEAKCLLVHALIKKIATFRITCSFTGVDCHNFSTLKV